LTDCDEKNAVLDIVEEGMRNVLLVLCSGLILDFPRDCPRRVWPTPDITTARMTRFTDFDTGFAALRVLGSGWLRELALALEHFERPVSGRGAR
jgi:hypothetical protein